MKVKILTTDFTEADSIKRLEKKVAKWLTKPGATVQWLQSSADTAFGHQHTITAVITYKPPLYDD